MKNTKKSILWSLLICLLLGAAGFGGWYWYDNNVDRSGWREKDSITMYADFHGKPVTGWLELEGERYYFDENHALQTGWLTLDGCTYYLDDGGRMQSQWLDTAEGRYWLGQDGILQTGWQQIGDGRFYFGSDGLMACGWQTLDDQRYYFTADGMTTGWLQLEDRRHYFNADGVLQAGWLELDDQVWYLDENGTPVTSWLELDAHTYCFDEAGLLLTGWQEIEGKLYYFSSDGPMHTGWLELGEYRYYLLEDGTAAVGSREIEGETFYFSPKGIQVWLVNPWNPVAYDYKPDLVEIEDGWMVDRQILEPLQAMLAAMREADLYPYFSSAYRNYETQQVIWETYVQRYMAQGYDQAQANAMTASYVAVPGTSEHHTGLAVDIVGHDYFYSGHPGSTMAVQEWLAEHCWEYGFILRYTAEKAPITGFAAETWHFRYVGTEVSMDMKDSGLCLEEYLNASRKK